MKIRKAVCADIEAVAQLYADVHTAEESGQITVGWQRGIYPERSTAEAALERGDLFVQEEDGRIVGAAIINQQQVDVYAQARWQYPADDEGVMVLHTLVIAPSLSRRGYGRAFVAYYEAFARANGCRCLRMDTNARKTRARRLYRALGYREADVVPCVFQGLRNVELVLLEKEIEE